MFNLNKMKIMKRIILLLFIGVFINQTGFSQLKFGVKMGLAATNFKMDASSDLDDLELPTSRQLNFDGGVVLEFDLVEDMISVRTGLDYTQKGFYVDLEGIKKKFNDVKDITGNWEASFQYLQLPVNFVYSLGDFNINAGPYLAYGLSGKEIQDVKVELTDGTILDINENYDLKPVFGNVQDDLSNADDSMLIQYFNGLDFGLNFGLGFNIKNVLVNIQYQQGLTNLTPELAEEPGFSASDLIAKHNTLSLEVTYFFTK